MVTRLLMAAAVALLVVSAAPAFAQKNQRSGMGPCRIGALSMIALLDRNEWANDDHKHLYAALVESCGPAAVAPAPNPPLGRDKCHDIAVELLDVIEDGKMNTKAFSRSRARFAQACAPT